MDILPLKYSLLVITELYSTENINTKPNKIPSDPYTYTIHTQCTYFKSITILFLKDKNNVGNYKFNNSFRCSKNCINNRGVN